MKRIGKLDLTRYAVPSSTSSSRYKVVVKRTYTIAKKKNREAQGSLINTFALIHFPADDDLSRGRVG